MALRQFSELGTGKKFPPEREHARVSNMDTWAQRYARKYADASRRLKPNSYRFVCNFWQEQVISTPPVFTYDGGGREQQALDVISPAIAKATSAVVVDLIRFGSGVYLNDIPWQPQATDPRFYFAVTKPEIGEYDGAIVACPYKVNPGSNLPDHIALTTYTAGAERASKAFYKLDGLTVGLSDGAPIEYSAAHPIMVKQGEGEYGISDYEDIDEYVEELHRRESSVSTALDRHTNPHLSIPEDSIRTNAAGKMEINQEGMIIPVPVGQGITVPQYITWNAKFEAQENAMDRAVERIQRFSRIAPGTHSA